MPTFFGPAGSGSESFDEFLARYLQGQRSAQSGRTIDMTKLLSRRSHAVLADAARYAIEHGHAEVDALHILHVLVETEPIAQAIRAGDGDSAQIADAAEQRLPGKTDDEMVVSPALTSAAQRALLDAHQVARAFGSTYIDPEHLFFAFVVNQEAPVGQLLAAFGVTPQSLQAGHEAARQEQASAGSKASSETPMLDQFGTDLTERARDGKLDPVIGRADEIAQTLEILSRRTKNNPVLIGEAGVGKTAVVEGIARAIVEGDVPSLLENKRVISLDLASMVGGTRYRGDFEERLTKLMGEITARKDELLIFIDELHTVVGAGGGGESGGMDAGNILKPRLARGDLNIIGATTLKEYRRIEKDSALERRFQPVQVDEPSVDDAELILQGLRGSYEEFHGVSYTDEAIRAAVDLSARYVTDRFLPDKAIDLIDQAGARMRLHRGPIVDTSELRAELATLEAGKNTAVAAEKYEDASRIRDEIEALNAQIASAESQGTASAGKNVIGESQIADIISRATGIPANRITQSDRQRLGSLEADLHTRVIGQDDAVTSIAKAVRRNRTGMGDPSRPVGSFLFLGPTGVGKTELAKALAFSLFGNESAMLRFDMSEFGERHTVSRLVGAPPGYVGYDEAGQLTERVRRNPYSVILLDEIEKAHPDVFNLLLQVLDDGRLTDGQGRTVDFRNTVIIMTSNIGSEFLASRSGALGFIADAANDSTGFGSEKALRDRVMGKLREAMRPEFLNRIDEVVLFRKLAAEQLHEIVRLLLRQTAARLDAQLMSLNVSDEAIDWIATHGYEPEFGARPLRRLIQREVDDRIAGLMVESELAAGTTIEVGLVGGELVVSSNAAEPQLAA
ncbi:ATP-dependent Clp protease ATP-binding subunit [Mycetocola zhadangensis]|uniref:ATP-dependent Clp protease ATP-binding subunit n=1 Tax=Mycetocola zhadangensis TaxID=1164595 RepID=A0A3L7J1A5_9MICO|nr:ATP-dependent Clp protease ATP-binding subunit [Mycetocola zhadangensis]RLQ84257.1 ATP-dependent Clp protease ATP-binding subunit [Mycetocola zhadangensis]GGE94668.1 ATPase AAA [Mycetocola zhadangensis]